MKGGLTVQDMDLRKRKTKAFDEALDYLRGRASSDEGLRVLKILESALPIEKGATR